MIHKELLGDMLQATLREVTETEAAVRTMSQVLNPQQMQIIRDLMDRGGIDKITLIDNSKPEGNHLVTDDAANDSLGDPQLDQIAATIKPMGYFEICDLVKQTNVRVHALTLAVQSGITASRGQDQYKIDSDALVYQQKIAVFLQSVLQEMRVPA